MTLKKVTVYTDGACSGNPGAGGWGCVLLYGENKKEMSGGEALTTNNRMELTAIIQALKTLKFPCEVDVFSDSSYALSPFQEGWIYGWEKKNWKRADNKPVLNDDLFRELLSLTRVHKVNFIKVKGHSDVELNNRCDYLARKAIDAVKDDAQL